MIFFVKLMLVCFATINFLLVNIPISVARLIGRTRPWSLSSLEFLSFEKRGRVVSAVALSQSMLDPRYGNFCKYNLHNLRIKYTHFRGSGTFGRHHLGAADWAPPFGRRTFGHLDYRASGCFFLASFFCSYVVSV